MTHQTIRKVGEDLKSYAFNTAVAALMEFVNALMRARERGEAGSPAWNEAVEALVLMLAPIAPHLAEELWERLGRPYSVHEQAWPRWSAELAAEETTEIVIQVNGKLRATIEVPRDLASGAVEDAALALPQVARWLDGHTPRKVIVVPNRIVNIVA